MNFLFCYYRTICFKASDIIWTLGPFFSLKVSRTKGGKNGEETFIQRGKCPTYLFRIAIQQYAQREDEVGIGKAA